MEIVPSASGAPFPYTLAPLPDALNRSLTDEESLRLERVHGTLPPPPRQQCRTCRKKGHFQTRLFRPNEPEGGEIVTCECNCREQWMLGRLLLNAGIGDTYQRYSWNHVRGVPAAITSQVLGYIDRLDAFANAGMGLLLHSERTGTGKSLLTYLVIKEALAQGYSAYFTTFTEMLDYHTAGWSDASMREWFVRKIQNAAFLAIDEMGKENPNRANVVNELLDRVIRARIAHGRPTLINTNLDPQRLDDVGKDFSRYQAGLLSLLAERTLTIRMDGSDYRETRQAELLADVMADVSYPVVVR